MKYEHTKAQQLRCYDAAVTEVECLNEAMLPLQQAISEATAPPPGRWKPGRKIAGART